QVRVNVPGRPTLTFTLHCTAPGDYRTEAPVQGGGPAYARCDHLVRAVVKAATPPALRRTEHTPAADLPF
ncbi:hypothetical protein, partial [Klebsiella pneumoniae]|uniref:hypothetical protein n=1 Tax=Klebsiella pneumoniae TaxID=573 RepID=UPI001D0E78F2